MYTYMYFQRRERPLQNNIHNTSCTDVKSAFLTFTTPTPLRASQVMTFAIAAIQTSICTCTCTCTCTVYSLVLYVHVYCKLRYSICTVTWAVSYYMCI